MPMKSAMLRVYRIWFHLPLIPRAAAYPADDVGPGCYTSATAFKRTLSSGTNAIVMKFAPDGRSVAYSTYVGAKVGEETLRAITVAPNRKAIITGVTTSTGIPTSQSAFQLTPKGPSPALHYFWNRTTPLTTFVNRWSAAIRVVTVCLPNYFLASSLTSATRACLLASETALMNAVATSGVAVLPDSTVRNGSFLW
jgi:hypothetical protein